jgi:ankyrin repeat protein/ketosteroid isomerase-like protein
MSVRPLPDRPDLGQLRRQAKELRDAALAADPAAVERLRPHTSGPTTLSAAQLAVAREHGFPSWPRLKAEVEARGLDREHRVDAFLEASVAGRTARAASLLAGDPGIATFDASTAAVLGEAAHLRGLLSRDPAQATRPDRRRGWPPLLYVCHSRWHRSDPARVEGMLEVARLLLDAGASPDTSNGRPSRAGHRSALYGAAGIADNPAITRLLLERGANPNDDESVYHASFHGEHACLRLLIEHGAEVNGTNALPAVVLRGDVEGVRILLDAGADPGRRPDGPTAAGHLADLSLNPLALAAASAPAAVVEALLAAGADPDTPDRIGRSAVRAAARRGRPDVVEALVRHGAHDDDVTEIDRLLGACARADRAEAEALLRRDPGLAGRLSGEDRAAIVDAAESADMPAVALMLDLGFPADVHRLGDGATALHSAAYMGSAGVVRLLIERGADLGALDLQWRSTALCWATVGSGEREGRAAGDWVGTIEALLAAGAPTRDAWVANKPPSDEVAALLARHGISNAGEPAEAEPPDPGPVPVERVAERLRAAYEAGDIDLLGSLLHADVRWGWGPGGCHNRAQVLERFGVLAARGVRAEVRDVLVRGDSVLLTLRRSPSGEGVYQVFRVANGAVAEIRGYADPEEALRSIGPAGG